MEQPEPCEDAVSRQAAIDALKKDMASLDHIIQGISANDVRLNSYVEQRNQINYDIDTIKHLPAAQPEPCEDAVSRQYLLDEYDRQHKGPPGGARKIIEEAPSVTPKQQDYEERKKGECSYYAKGFCQQVSGDRCNVCSLRGKA